MIPERDRDASGSRQAPLRELGSAARTEDAAAGPACTVAVRAGAADVQAELIDLTPEALPERRVQRAIRQAASGTSRRTYAASFMIFPVNPHMTQSS